eukprot:CAMPEP_0206400938 /NCGR_PEP_ID=MMETSP0294-20121207/25903_1 /ASSEMBLY_ACC=CAM_ASM_000327 /TAXON_ID=39354 /ORGANISM="Heterosigma akashiwo, Strain CCMP2393" /LENGTH=102 /DNA_ID=CAMNT_0053857405 /DNA_START=63 /DNA_END=371 /DNA_ORIENTATION=+
MHIINTPSTSNPGLYTVNVPFLYVGNISTNKSNSPRPALTGLKAHRSCPLQHQHEDVDGLLVLNRSPGDQRYIINKRRVPKPQFRVLLEVVYQCGGVMRVEV